MYGVNVYIKDESGNTLAKQPSLPIFESIEDADLFARRMNREYSVYVDECCSRDWEILAGISHKDVKWSDDDGAFVVRDELLSWPINKDYALEGRIFRGITMIARYKGDGELYEVEENNRTGIVLYNPPVCPVCNGARYVEDVPVGERYPATFTSPAEPWYVDIECRMCEGFGIIDTPPHADSRRYPVWQALIEGDEKGLQREVDRFIEWMAEQEELEGPEYDDF